MCHTEYSQYECGHSTVVEIACQHATVQNKSGCRELPTDNMDDVTRLQSLCSLCERDQRRRPSEPFVRVEDPPMQLPEDPNCGNSCVKPQKEEEISMKDGNIPKKAVEAPKKDEQLPGSGWWQTSKDLLWHLLS